MISRSQDPHLPQPENRDSRSLFLLTQKLIDQTYSLAIIISPRYSIRQKRTYSRTLVSSYEHICIVYRGPRDEVIFDGESDIILCRYSRYVETNSLPEKMCGYMNLYFWKDCQIWTCTSVFSKEILNLAINISIFIKNVESGHTH